MANDQAVPPTYVQRIRAELDSLKVAYRSVLNSSAIRNVHPGRGGGGGVTWIGYQNWGWVPSEDSLTSERMRLLAILDDLKPRIRLLFRHPTPEVAKRLTSDLSQLEKWLDRGQKDHSVPKTVDAAQLTLNTTFQDLNSLLDLLPADPWAVRIAVDTNALIDDPDLTIYKPVVGDRYMAHLFPVVLREIDDKKRAGNNPDLRDAAKRADKRLKGLRTNGDPVAGVKVAGDVWAVFEHIEPKGEGLPNWIDLTVPDDRFVGSSLLLQSRHPGSALYIATSDINLQTKLAAVGLPFVEV